MYSRGSSSAGSDKDVIRTAIVYKTLVGSHPELDIKPKSRRSGASSNYNAKNPEQLQKALDERKKARDIEHDWTQKQIQQLKEEQSRLAEEEARLRKAKERWGSPLGGISEPDISRDILQRRENSAKSGRSLVKPENEASVRRGCPSQDAVSSWQAPEFYMVRELLVQLTNEAVDKAEESSFQIQSDTLELLIKAAQQDRSANRQSLDREKVAILSTGNLLEEFIHEMVRGIAEESINREQYVAWQKENIIIGPAETAADASRDSGDPAHDLVTGTYRQMMKERQVKRPGVWLHTQAFMAGDSEVVEDMPALDPDTKLLDFMTLRPLHKRKATPALKIYQQKEVASWSQFTIEPTTVALHKKVGGVSSASVSSNQQQLAVGTMRGDLLTYSLMQAAPQVVRYIRNEGAIPDPVVSLSWSLDGNRITTVNRSGSLQVWSTYPGGRSTADAKELDLTNIYTKSVPPQLSLLLSMDSHEEEFNFQAGPFAESGVQKETGIPTLTAFHPSTSLLVTQNSIMVALQTGDILKCNAELSILEKNEEADDTPQPKSLHLPMLSCSGDDLLGHDVPGELFRGHRSPLVCMGFVGNYDEMVTVDSWGNIFIWKYERSTVSHFGWFEPERKYSLLLAEMAYEPVKGEEKVVYFSDESAAQLKKKKGREAAKIRQSWERKRAAAQSNVERMDYRDVFIKEVDSKANRVLTVTEPLSLEGSGTHFHGIVQEMSTKKLLKHFSQIYRVVKNHCTRLLDCQLNPDGTELIFCLLFPAFYPKEPHISFITVYLDAEIRVQSRRIDIRLYDKEYTRCLQENVCSFAVSQVMDASKSSYLFVTLIGSLVIYSRNTGTLLVSTRETDTPLTAVGSVKGLPRINVWSRMKVAHCAGHIQVIFHVPQETTVTILHVIDRSSAKSRRLVHKAYQLWSGGPSEVPLELTTQRSQYTLDRDRYRHPELYLRRLVLQLVDRAIEEVDGDFTREEIHRNMMADRVTAIGYLSDLQVEQG